MHTTPVRSRRRSRIPDRHALAGDVLDLAAINARQVSSRDRRETLARGSEAGRSSRGFCWVSARSTPADGADPRGLLELRRATLAAPKIRLLSKLTATDDEATSPRYCATRGR
jgi:hypothetical protein